MKTFSVVMIVVAAIGAALALRYGVAGPKARNASAGRDLRLMMLTKPPAAFGVSPNADFPHVYGILMDWPIGAETATVFSTSTGAASLYTTSTFGVLGGEAHESVRLAATAFVKAANGYFSEAAATTDFPYPGPDRVRFYLLTFDGVRCIESDLAAINELKDPHAELFGLGQQVVTELRMLAQAPSRAQ